MNQLKQIFEFECKICYRQYNQLSVQPMIICKNFHVICRPCLTIMTFGKIDGKCSFCHVNIRREQALEYRYLPQFKLAVQRFKLQYKEIIHQNLMLKKQNEIILRQNKKNLENIHEIHKDPSKKLVVQVRSYSNPNFMDNNITALKSIEKKLELLTKGRIQEKKIIKRAKSRKKIQSSQNYFSHKKYLNTNLSIKQKDKLVRKKSHKVIPFY